MTEPNAARAYVVLDHIEARPDLWEQAAYIAETGCGTVACFAGWTALLFGEGEPAPNSHGWILPSGITINIDRYADQLLGGMTFGLGPGRDESLYDAANELGDLHRMVAEAFGRRPVTA